MYKTILLDIDGTLTNDEKIITRRTKEALLAAQEKGIILALASGRPKQGLYKWARELEMDRHHGLFVCYNGALVVDCETGEEIYTHDLSKNDAKEVLAHIEKFEVTPIISKGEYMHTTDVFGCVIDQDGKPLNLVEYESRSNGYILCEHKNLADWLDVPVKKILTAGDPEYLKAHYEEMQAPFADRLNCMFTASFYFEYTAKGVDKARAIERGYTGLGIKREEMVAFGDAQNDLTMLQYVGLGVAMGNAFEEVKVAADEVTLDNNHDGIAVALEKHGII